MLGQRSGSQSHRDEWRAFKYFIKDDKMPMFGAVCTNYEDLTLRQHRLAFHLQHGAIFESPNPV